MIEEFPRLLDQVINRLRLKQYSYRTEQTYLNWIKRLIYCHILQQGSFGIAHSEAVIALQFYKLAALPCSGISLSSVLHPGTVRRPRKTIPFSASTKRNH
ncbi:MAG: hypothetical protein GY759_21685 [Chloroflexi bacterium]|nr:hypothetical protein [Chloroflexota bacterium]